MQNDYIQKLKNNINIYDLEYCYKILFLLFEYYFQPESIDKYEVYLLLQQIINNINNSIQIIQFYNILIPNRIQKMR